MDNSKISKTLIFIWNNDWKYKFQEYQNHNIYFKYIFFYFDMISKSKYLNLN